eukprot:Rhum_TRINITY_DN12280_c1_g1::Rhum_TRINITY_DN12280_c1_g1_i1::g.50697::m.50697
MAIRFVAGGILAPLWIYLVCTGFVLLNLLVISEAVDRNANYEMRDYDIHFWHFIGLPCFSLVFCGIVCCAIIPIVEHFASNACRAVLDKLHTTIVAIFAYCQIVIYLLFCTIGFFAPFTDFRGVELSERGIAGTHAPGWAPINCMTDKTPKSIDVRTDIYSYFALADPQWSVAFDNRTAVAKEEKWSWVVAPILYDGPVDDCKTKYPLFVVCVDKTITPSKCWWDNERRGSWTHIRLLKAAHEMEDVEKKKFYGKWVPNPYNTSQKVKLHHENLFEFNSPSYDETIMYLEYKRNEYYTLKWKGVVGWFAASAPGALLACIVIVCSVFKHHCCKPSETDSDDRTEQTDSPPAPTFNNQQRYSVEDEEMAALPAKEDEVLG